MINNFICENCTHFTVCKVADKLAPFSDEAKKELGVAITIDGCIEFKDVHIETEA